MKINRICIYAAALTILLMNLAGAQSSSTKPQRFLAYTLKVPFKVQSGTLVICGELAETFGPEPLPLLCIVPTRQIPEKNVYGYTPITATVIKSIRDLRGKVTIRDSRSALAYLRLFSSLLTRHLVQTPLGRRAVEIMSVDQINDEITFGNKEYVSAWKTYFSGCNGVLYASEANKLKVGDVRLSNYQGDYLVTRDMLIEKRNAKQPQPYRVVERVTPNGNYSLVSMTRLKLAAPRSLDWRIYDPER